MKFDVLTLFPEWFGQFAELGVVGRAIEQNRLKLDVWNPRDDALNQYGQVDDRPYGGGPGMVMQYEPLKKTLDRCLAASGSDSQKRPLVVALSPQGEVLNNAWVQRLATEEQLVLICGRYEGLDERFVEEEVDVEISTGDYVVSGGELPAMLLMDAIARWIPGVLGDAESALADSFAEGLLDHPHYTRPESIALAGKDEQLAVPDVLLSGNHAAIRQWRSQQALARTWLRRPDLIEGLLDSGKLTQAQQSQVLQLICDLVAERME